MLTVVREAGATATLVRINPELPLADRLENQPHTFSLLARGLDAVRAIDPLGVRRSEFDPAELERTFEAAHP